jgi:uncharacterized membrane protein YgcG
MPPGQRSQYGGNVYWLNQPQTVNAPLLPRLPTQTPVIPKAIVAPYTGTGGSRAYANTHGAQVGMPSTADQQKWADTLKWNAAVAANSALNKSTGGSSGGSSGGGGSSGVVAPVESAFTPQVADLSRNPYPGFYDTLLAYVKANADNRPSEYAAISDQFKARQATANQQMYDMYQGSRAQTDASATALGADPAIVSAARDLAMRRSQENSDQSLADNQAWLLKMGELSKQQGEAYLNQFAGQGAAGAAAWVGQEQQRVADANLAAVQALLAKQVAASKGGGGGRKSGGGGGSSSGAITDTATETTTDAGTYDPAVVAALQGNPKALAEYMNQINLSSPNKVVAATQGNVNSSTAARDKAIKAMITTIGNPFAHPMSPAQITANQVSGQTAASQLPIYQAVLNQLAGAPQVSKKVVTTSKNKTPAPKPKANPKVL